MSTLKRSDGQISNFRGLVTCLAKNFLKAQPDLTGSHVLITINVTSILISFVNGRSRDFARDLVDKMSQCTVCAVYFRRGLRKYVFRENKRGIHEIGHLPFSGKRKCPQSKLACAKCYEAARKQVCQFPSSTFPNLDLFSFDSRGPTLLPLFTSAC